MVAAEVPRGLDLVVAARIEDTSSLVNKTVKMPTPPLIRLAMVVVAHLVNKTVKMPTPPLIRLAMVVVAPWCPACRLSRLHNIDMHTACT